MKKNSLAPLRPLFVLFVILSAFFISSSHLLDKWKADKDVLIIGNLILLIITLISYLLISRGVNTTNNQAFIRSIYISFILKFFLIIATVFLYATLAKELNKSALFICAIIYLVYNFIEVAALTKLVKQKKNA
jgi:hypothetical protein